MLLLPCDYCGSKTAVLFCRADSAKLCLLCDQHVHSANALSLKHVRYQICDNCKNEIATVRCVTDNLVLCQDCDWDSHNDDVSMAWSSPLHHERYQIEGLSGCPSVFEIASALGFELKPNTDVGSGLNDKKFVEFQGPVVPIVHASVSLCKGQNNLVCGKFKDDVYEQVVEMARRSVVARGHEDDGAELGPVTPPVELNNSNSNNNNNNHNNNGNDDDELLMQQTPFTSLLMLPSDVDTRKNDYGSDAGDLLWNCNPAYQAPQVWDFQLQKSRDCGESRVVTFNGLDEASELFPKTLQDVHNMNCSTICDDIVSRNNQSDQSSSSHVMMKEGSNKKARVGLSSEAKLIESITYNSTVQVAVTENHVNGSENVSTIKAKVSLEELAKNRGDAMLRYKEKKKTRRYDKHIRYESRKARADTRKRVKGRFVKASDTDDV